VDNGVLLGEHVDKQLRDAAFRERRAVLAPGSAPRARRSGCSTGVVEEGGFQVTHGKR
jgi:hypothetical protein